MSSNTPQPDTNASVDEAASLWAARIEGSTLGAADRDALDAWLAADPSHRAALTHYCQLSADLEQRMPALVSAGLVDRPQTRSGSRKAFGRNASAFRYPIIGALAAAALVVAVRWFSAPAPSANQPSIQFATAAGEQKTVVLADGSTVEMNAQTRFTFVNSAGTRRVQLAGGEAFFSVAKLTPSVPFLVETAAGTVRVTGTRFAVRTESSTDLEVTVEEGSVAVDATSLKANDRLTLQSGRPTVSTLAPTEVADALLWRKGKISTKSMTLREAAARFARFNGISIPVGSTVGTEGMFGIFDLKDTQGLINYVNAQSTVRASRLPDGSISIEPR